MIVNGICFSDGVRCLHVIFVYIDLTKIDNRCSPYLVPANIPQGITLKQLSFSFASSPVETARNVFTKITAK